MLARDGCVVYANPAARALAAESTAPVGVRDGLASLWECGAEEGRFDLPLTDRFLHCRAVLDRRRAVALAYLTDVTDARRASEELARAHGHDALTGLGNRTSFEARVEQALLDRPDRRVVVLLLNVDRLRRVNEGLGHAAGDHLLVQVARRVAAVARAVEPIAGEAFRFDGDTFAILVAAPGVDAAPARLAGALLATLSVPFSLDEREVTVTASAGIAVAPGDGDGGPALLRAAEVALDDVKKRGGNGFRCYAPALDAMARDYLDLESGLRRGLVGNELFLAFQTQVDLVSGREIGREALLRWRHPEHGLVAPAHFIPVAEESGIIGPLGSWALREACRVAAGWSAPADLATVAVNVSPLQLHGAGFVEHVATNLADASLPAERLEIEVTESAAMEDHAAVARTLVRLKDIGVGIALDDFGTGHSSLSRLCQLPIDTLKIDRSFVDGIGQDRDSETLTRGIVEIGHRLGMSVLAEGVETEDQAAVLRGWGCDAAQGFLFGRPIEGR